MKMTQGYAPRRKGYQMMWRVVTASLLAVMLGACGADMTLTYASTPPPTPFNEGQADIPGSTGVPSLPGISAPSLFISYPIEESNRVCLDPGNTIVVYYSFYGAPAGSRARFRVDRHLSGGIDQGTFGFNDTCTLLDGSTSLEGCARLDLSATSSPVGYHLVDGWLTDAGGDELTGIPGNNLAHRFQVNFTTRARTVDSTVCPIVCVADGDCPTGAVCDDGWCATAP